MTAQESLLRGFGVATSPDSPDPLRGRVSDALLAIWDAARDAHPDVRIEPSVFGQAVASRVDPQAPVPDAIAAIPAADLLLVLGCAAGQRAALETIDTQFMNPLRPAIAALGASADVIDDVLSQVRARLMVGTPPEPPRILQFRGQSSLQSWLKVIVIREGMAVLRRAKNEIDEDDELEALMISGDQVEFAHVRERYQSAFRSAFGEALAELDPTQRTVLRHHLLDRLSIDEIGALHKVHRSTAARWLTKIRDHLHDRTRARLLARLQLESAEFDGVMALVRSQLEYSIGRHLAGSFAPSKDPPRSG